MRLLVVLFRIGIIECLLLLHVSSAAFAPSTEWCRHHNNICRIPQQTSPPATNPVATWGIGNQHHNGGVATTFYHDRHHHHLQRRQRCSVAYVQTMGLFGLGGLEIAVIVVGIGVVLGPEKIISMIQSSGETAAEYKKEISRIPDEFQKGMEAGEMEARSRKAKKVVMADDADEAATTTTSKE